MEINQIQCTTANINDWLKKSVKFLNHFASLLKFWNFCQNFGVPSLHHIIVKKLICWQNLQIFWTLLKIGFFANILEFFWCIMHKWWKFGFLPTCSNFLNYIESPTKSWISCQNSGVSWVTLLHCENLGFPAINLKVVELKCCTAENLKYFGKILEVSQWGWITDKNLIFWPKFLYIFMYKASVLKSWIFADILKFLTYIESLPKSGISC